MSCNIIGHMINFDYLVADVKPFFVIWYIALADVIANVYCGRSYCQYLWQIVLPYQCGGCYYHLYLIFTFFSKVADVIAFMYVEDGKTTCYLQIILADAVAMVADGIATQNGSSLWQMLKP